MKRNSLLIAMVVMLVPALALAVAEGDKEITLGVGASLPTGDFGDFADPGVLVDGSVAYYLSPHLALGGDVGYHAYGSELDDADISMIHATGLAKYVFGREDANGAPFVKLALGFYFPSFSYTTTLPGLGEEEVSDTDTEIGVGIGGGYQYQFQDSDWGIFGEVMYHSAGDAEFVGVRAGATILWGDAKRKF